MRVTGVAQREIQAVATAAPANRSALFATAPLIVSEYAPATAALALDWFEEIRDTATPAHIYVPTPRIMVTDDDVSTAVAFATQPLHELQIADLTEQVIAEANAATEAAVQRMVAAGFWDTVTGNSDDDPDAVGWSRFTQGGGCKFCQMLASRGAVYTERSVNFAAHKHCHCVAGPSYDASAPRASVIQYVASKRNRSEEESARVRDYLNHNFPDAPG